MVAKKRKSKRTSLGQKYKIIKRTKQHHQRMNKGLLGPGRKKKVDNHIPNAWPYKEDLLNQIAVAKEKMEEVRLRQKEKRRDEIAARRAGKKAPTSNDDMEGSDEEEDSDEEETFIKNKLNVPVNPQDFTMDSEHFESTETDHTHGGKDLQLGKNSRRAYLKELRKTVEGADVVLQVLDARDPMGTLSTAVEEMISSKDDKKLVYVLNKSDLVPREVLAGWLSYLRRSRPTIPFKSNTQQGQNRNLGRAAGKVSAAKDGALQTNQAVGTEELIGLLKNYSRLGDSKSVIVVGIVGFPNVGKSSLINSLMRSRAVGVSSMPGYTKVAQEVILDKNIRLMDSPGIVFADGDSSATTLRNCVNVDDLEDVLSPVQAILERCPPGYLMQLYSIPAFKTLDCMSFLALVARSQGKLKKGGAPNTDQAARSVLHDWNNGKIKYYCKVPQTAFSHSTEEEGDAKIVAKFSEESTLMADADADENEGLKPEDLRVLDELEGIVTRNAGGTSYVPMDDMGENMREYEDDEYDNMTVTSGVTSHSAKTSSKGSRATSTTSAKKAGKVNKKDAYMNAEEEVPEDARKSLKKTTKKNKKDARRAGNTGSKKEVYDFDMDFK